MRLVLGLELAVAGSSAIGCKASSGHADAADGTGGSASGLGGSGAGAGGSGMGGGGAPGTGGSPAGAGGARVGCDNPDIDVPSATVTGGATLDGVSGAGLAEHGLITLLDASGGAATIGSTNHASFSAPVIPGTYDLFFQDINPAPHPTVPQNLHALLRTGVVVSASGPTDIRADIPTVALTGSVTIGGVAILDSNDDGQISLTTALPLIDAIGLGITSLPGYSARVVPGTYDLSYRRDGVQTTPTAGARAPLNDGATVRSGVVVPASGTFTLNVDVPVTTSSGTLKINGADAPAATSTLLFMEGSADNPLPLGNVWLGHPSDLRFSVALIPGTYNVRLGAGDGSTTPINSGIVRAGVVIPPGPTPSTIDIDIPVATLTGSVTIAGAAGSADGNHGDIYLVGPMYSEGHLAATSAPAYTTKVLPGTYDVYYRAASDQLGVGNAPRNTNARIAEGVVIAPAGTTTLNVDVPSVVVSGQVSVNGVPAPASAVSHGDFFLRSASGDEARLTNTNTRTYSARVVPGTYDLLYRAALPVDPRTPLPVNRNARLRSGIVVGATGTTTLDIDLPTVTVSGSFKIAGAAVADPQDYGQLELRDDFGDTVELGKTSDLTYSVKVVPGSYDLYYSIQRGGTIAPVNSSTRLRCFNVSR